MPPSGSRSTASAAPDWAAHGKVPRLDRFLLGPEIGRGAMGRVVRAWDPMLRRVVAVKLLLQEDPMEMARFLHEAQLQAGVDHPNVCRIYEVGSSIMQPYIAMQLIDGHTLDHFHGRLSMEEIARVIADIASAIHAAHRHGLIHRDIKPGNILLEPPQDGRHRAYIMDFGLAKRMGEGTEPGMPWAADGTPAYMSPEQARGEAIGPTSDIYSLGATIFACLCGEPPRGPMAPRGGSEARDLHLLRTRRPDLPGDLEAILLKCLHADPQLRYAGAALLEEDLRAWLAGKPVHARRPGIQSKIERSFRRHRSFWLAGGMGVLGVAALVSWHFRERSRERILLECTTRFLLEVSLEESLLGRERQLPPHDIRPALERARSRIASIERDMVRIGGSSLAPGHYAIGRVYLDLGELEKAEQHLQKAWSLGLSTPDIAAALGTAKAQRHFEELDQMLLKQPENLGAELRGLRNARLKDIEIYLRQAPREGSSLRNLAYGEAFLALARGEYATAASRFRQASGEAPWLYEACLMEARALELLDDTGAPGEASLRRARWEACLDQAQRIAPSDDRVYAAQIRRHVRLGRLALREGRSPESAFQRAREVFEQSRVVRPDSPHITAAMLSLLATTLRNRLERGEDVRTELLDVVERHRSLLEREGGAPVLAGDVLSLAHTLAEQLHAHGADPRPWLEWAARHLEPRDPVSWLENRRMLAQVQIDWSLDPRRTFDGLFQKLDQLKATHGSDAAIQVASGRIWMEMARWKRERGAQDLDPLLRAGEAFLGALALHPNHVEATLSLARVRAAQALSQALARQEFDPALREARGLLESQRSGSLGFALAQGELGLAEALCHGGLEGHLSRARVEEGVLWMERALQRNPASIPVRSLLGEFLLMRARVSMSEGGDPSGILGRVAESARAGLLQKGDAVELKLQLTRVAAFQALRTWPSTAPRRGDASAVHLAVQARQLSPGRPECQWLHGLLAYHETRENAGLVDLVESERAAPAAIARLLATLPLLPAGLRKSS